jgi:hypothetical protein
MRFPFRATTLEEQDEINAEGAALIPSLAAVDRPDGQRIYLPARLHLRDLDDFTQEMLLYLLQVSLPKFDAHLQPAARPQTSLEMWIFWQPESRSVALYDGTVRQSARGRTGPQPAAGAIWSDSPTSFGPVAVQDRWTREISIQAPL